MTAYKNDNLCHSRLIHLAFLAYGLSTESYIYVMILRMQKHVTLEKTVGETPLACVETWRATLPEMNGVSLAYAGRLDPMASGKLLVLIGEECKNQTHYHSLDKEYEFSILFGIDSDTHDVLGRLKTEVIVPEVNVGQLTDITIQLVGEIELPYPHFSAKTVQGKPLHVWTLEERLDEIEIPSKHSTIYSMEFNNIETKSRIEVAKEARAKIDTIPEVTEASKALGNDFRRTDVRKDWEVFATDNSLPEEYKIATFTCVSSSGTYMRTLASVIANKLNTVGVAWNIHRTKIGVYDSRANTWKVLFD